MGCSPQCKNESCGDFIVNNNGTEVCDLGTVNNNKKLGCNPQCQFEYCGDSIQNNNGTE